MKMHNAIHLSWILIFISAIGFFFAASAAADDDHGYRRRESRHSIFRQSDDEGNETAGQMTAWLLLVANFPVALSLLTKGVNRYAPLGGEVKKSLASVNRMQKKALMRLHYYFNPAILGIALWHWLTSRCKSTSLPELGLMMMATVVLLGILIKFKLSPKAFRKYIYQIHTQPIIFLTMFLVLTVGHLLVD